MNKGGKTEHGSKEKENKTQGKQSSCKRHFPDIKGNPA
jgi:hypothetical protein